MYMNLVSVNDFSLANIKLQHDTVISEIMNLFHNGVKMRYLKNTWRTRLNFPNRL